MKEEYEQVIKDWQSATPITMELLDAKLNGLLVAVLGNRECMEAFAAGLSEVLNDRL